MKQIPLRYAKDSDSEDMYYGMNYDNITNKNDNELHDIMLNDQSPPQKRRRTKHKNKLTKNKKEEPSTNNNSNNANTNNVNTNNNKTNNDNINIDDTDYTKDNHHLSLSDIMAVITAATVMKS